MSEIVVYPPEMVADNERLLAVYSLLEQMRLEHNRVGEIALSSWKEFQGKWAQYARIFKARQLPLLQEQNRLKDAIRRANYTDEQWKLLTRRQAVEADDRMFGDERVADQTKATSDLLSQLKSVDFLKLEGRFVDPTEDFTAFTEVDSAGDIAVTASKVSWDTMRNDAHSYVYKDYGVDHFGDFEHLLTINTSSVSGADGEAHFWSMANQAAQTFMDLYYVGGFCLFHNEWGDYLELAKFNPWAEQHWAITVPYTYYVTIARSGTTLSCKIYSDASRTTLLATLSVTVPATAFRYLAVGCSLGGSGADNVTGYSENLDLQEAGGETARTSEEAGAGVDSRLSLLAGLVRADTGGGSDGIQVRGLASGDVGLGADTGMIPGQKNLLSDDSGVGVDALKAIVGTSGAGSDMKLPGRQGHVTIPSKGVSL